MPRETYCTQLAASGYLIPHQADLIASGVFGSARALEGRITQLLPITKAAIDRACERDFDYYEDDEVTFDGDGKSNTLFFGPLGKTPLLSIASITEDGIAVAAATYARYENEGWVRKVSSFREGGAWAEGVQNVVVTCTYGYEDLADIPPEIPDAQAKMIAAGVLAQGAGSGSGGVQGMTIGSFSVRYGEGHAWASVITDWMGEAKGVCDYCGRHMEL